MRGVRSAVFGTSSASAVITIATHCQCMWRQRGAGRRWCCVVHSLLSYRWSLQLFTTIRPCLSPTVCWRNLVFTRSTSTVPAGDNRVTSNHFSRRHRLVVSHSQTEHLSCGTGFPGRCKPLVPCWFSRKKFYHSLTLRHARGDKPSLRKSTDRKAQISPLN